MIEANKIYNESNCDTMGKMEPDSVDLVVTSPPYDDLRTYKGYEWNFEEVAQGLYKVLKPGGVVVWVVNDATSNGSESLTSCKQKIYFKENCGFNIFDTMIYKKNGPAYPSNDKYFQIFEYMFVLSKGKPKTFNPIEDRFNYWYGKKFSKVRTRRKKDGTLTTTTWDAEQGGQYGKRFNIWEYNVGAGYTTKDEIASQHPAIFPEALARDHILSWSNEGDLVYDSFMGSGTTAKMCLLTNRNYIGSEISNEYCEIARQRLKPYIDQFNMFKEVI